MALKRANEAGSPGRCLFACLLFLDCSLSFLLLLSFFFILSLDFVLVVIHRAWPVSRILLRGVGANVPTVIYGGW